MSAEHPPREDVSPSAYNSPLRRGRPWIAWCVIASVASFVVWQHSQPAPQVQKTAENRFLGTIADWQVRYLVGAAKMFPQTGNAQFAAAAPVDSGPIEQRLRGMVALGEISGPKAAAQKLKTLDEKQATGENRQVIDSLQRLYGDLVEGKPKLPSLGAADRERLAERLGWSGALAIRPAGGADAGAREVLLAEARRTVVISLILLVSFGALSLGGLVALATIVVLLLGRPQSRRLAAPTPRGGIYAETFAVWFVLYLALGYAAGWLPVGQSRYLLATGIMLASLTALGWPVMRGIPWSIVRDDIGLHFGRKPLIEIVLGPVIYLAAMPLVIVGVVIMLALLTIQRSFTGNPGVELSQNLPSHPIVSWLVDADWRQKLQIAFLAGVMAPVMEETMFRGVLYRHLRDATSCFGYAASVLSSALAVSFLFAVIHPQGWIAMPALMALALAFALAREWRGTLLPAMLAHGINNLLVTWLLISIS